MQFKKLEKKSFLSHNAKNIFRSFTEVEYFPPMMQYGRAVLSFSQEMSVVSHAQGDHEGCSHLSSSVLQILSDGVQLHDAVIQHVCHLSYYGHNLLLAAFLQLSGFVYEVLVHSFEESSQGAHNVVGYLCRSHHRRIHNADHLDRPADFPVLGIVLCAGPEERVAAQPAQALIDEVEDVRDLQHSLFVLLQQTLDLFTDRERYSSDFTQKRKEQSDQDLRPLGLPSCLAASKTRLTFLRSFLLLTLSEMAAEAEVIPPAVATPTPTAVITRDAPKVTGAKARPVMAATVPTAVVVPPLIPAILAL